MLPMKSLVSVLEAEGYQWVRTYIQSGNVVLRAAKGTVVTIGKRIAQAISENFAFDVPVMVLSETELSEAVRCNPFPKTTDEPAKLHLCFLAETPVRPDLDSLAAVKTAKEAFALQDRVFYMHTPDGAGNSKLAAKVERALGVDTTCRNWCTAAALLGMCREISAPN